MSVDSRRVVAWVWLVFFLGLIIGSVVWVSALARTMAKQKAAPPQVFGKVSAFKLTDENGAPFTLDTLKGKIWVADFIFTRCGGPCPLMSQKMAELQRALGSRAWVELVSFSVDPDHDKPATLKQYAARYRAKPGVWHFLTGPKKDIVRLLKDDFKIGYAEASAEAPENAIIHGTHLVLVDRNGQIRGYYGVGEDPSLEPGAKPLRPDAITRLIADIEAIERGAGMP